MHFESAKPRNTYSFSTSLIERNILYKELGIYGGKTKVLFLCVAGIESITCVINHMLQGCAKSIWEVYVLRGGENVQAHSRQFSTVIDGSKANFSTFEERGVRESIGHGKDSVKHRHVSTNYKVHTLGVVKFRRISANCADHKLIPKEMYLFILEMSLLIHS